MYVKWKLNSVRLEIVLVSAQDRCTVCAEHTIGLEIILDAPDGTRWRCGSSGMLVSVCLEIVLILVQNRYKVCAERTIGSEIFLGTSNGTAT
jgi:hypothetical protein